MKKPQTGRLPSFIGVGPARTGTTWVHRVLEGYVGLPQRTKETDFFSTNYRMGVGWYRAHFTGYPAETVIGEITPTYFDDPDSPRRIAELIPQCKIIVSLREPVARLYSHYRLLRVEGWIRGQAFAEALKRQERWSEKAGNMIGASRYALHLRRWLEVFGRANTLVTFFDDLETAPQAYIDQLTAFVGIPRIELAQTSIGTTRVNQREHAPKYPRMAERARRLRDVMERRQMYRTIASLDPVFRYYARGGTPFPPLDPSIAQELQARFRPEIEELEVLTGRDLSAWKGPLGRAPN